MRAAPDICVYIEIYLDILCIYVLGPNLSFLGHADNDAVLSPHRCARSQYRTVAEGTAAYGSRSFQAFFCCDIEAAFDSADPINSVAITAKLMAEKPVHFGVQRENIIKKEAERKNAEMRCQSTERNGRSRGE